MNMQYVTVRYIERLWNLWLCECSNYV